LKIHIKGASLQHARDLIKACIDNDDSLASLRLLLDPDYDCIQVDGLRVAGVPVGCPQFIANYVRSKALDIVQDVAKLRIMEDDSLVHYPLFNTCQHKRLAFLARNLSPAQMTMPASRIVGLQHVDRAVSQAILQAGTSGNFTAWPHDVQQWCERVLQLPHHLGSFGITPLVQSGKAGFYSATANFLSWLATLPNADFWLPHKHVLTQPDTWECQRLAAFRTKGPEIPLQRRITAWILKQPFLAQPDAPTSCMGQMVQLHQAQSIVTVGPTRDVDLRDYSILQTDMPHHDDVDEPGKKHGLTCSVAGWLTPQYLAWKDQSGVATSPSLTLQGWQSWFCQFLGVAPSCTGTLC
jgi:hypothetical protein